MNKGHYISIRLKMTIGVILICFLMSLLATIAVNRIATNIIDQEYADKAAQITEAVANTIDPAEVEELSRAVLEIYGDGADVVPSSEWGSDEWNAYMAKYSEIESLPVFNSIRDELRMYQDIFGVDCLYITNYKKEVQHAIYIVDGAYEDACPPGCVDSFEDGLWPDTPETAIPATITNEEVYGWLVSAAHPILLNGKSVGHLCVDISMNEIKEKERNYVVKTTLVMIAVTALLIVLALIFVTRNIIRPIRTLSDTARNYCSENNDVEHHSFEKIESTGTHDEIAELLASMKQMEADMNSNINSLVDAKVALREAEEKSSTLQALAIKDSLTGVRNKTAYDFEVKKLEEDLADGFNEFGLAMVDLNFLKRTNDTYGHEKGNISIRRLCMLVCEIFEHSPVFRIGGDEFIVILKNRDYRNVDNLIRAFNDHLDAVQKDDTLNPWEQISAAIGYYKFDKKVDKTVEDVFKKADKAMYDRKVAMKAERKD